MLIKKGNRFELYPHKVKYTQRGKEIEQWALPNKEWWVEFAEKWEHTEIIEFKELELTEAQLRRFEKIKHESESFKNDYINYILNGVFPEELPKTHPLYLLKLEKENEEMKTVLDTMLGVE